MALCGGFQRGSGAVLARSANLHDGADIAGGFEISGGDITVIIRQNDEDVCSVGITINHCIIGAAIPRAGIHTFSNQRFLPLVFGLKVRESALL